MLKCRLPRTPLTLIRRIFSTKPHRTIKILFKKAIPPTTAIPSKSKPVLSEPGLAIAVFLVVFLFSVTAPIASAAEKPAGTLLTDLYFARTAGGVGPTGLEFSLESAASLDFIDRFGISVEFCPETAGSAVGTEGWRFESGFIERSLGNATVRLLSGDRDLSFGPVFRLADSSVRTSRTKGIEVRAELQRPSGNGRSKHRPDVSGRFTGTIVGPIPNAGDDGILKAVGVQVDRRYPDWNGRLRAALVNHDSTPLSGTTVTNRTMAELGATYKRKRPGLEISAAVAGLRTADSGQGREDRFTDGAFYGAVTAGLGDIEAKAELRINGGRFESLANRGDPAPPGYRTLETSVERVLFGSLRVGVEKMLRVPPAGPNQAGARLKLRTGETFIFGTPVELALSLEAEDLVSDRRQLSATIMGKEDPARSPKLEVVAGISKSGRADRFRITGENGAGTKFRFDLDESGQYRTGRFEIETSEPGVLPENAIDGFEVMLKVRRNSQSVDPAELDVIGAVTLRKDVSETEQLTIRAGIHDGGRLTAGWNDAPGIVMGYSTRF